MQMSQVPSRLINGSTLGCKPTAAGEMRRANQSNFAVLDKDLLPQYTFISFPNNPLFMNDR